MAWGAPMGCRVWGSLLPHLCAHQAPLGWGMEERVLKRLLVRHGQARCAGTNRASQGFSDITKKPTNPCPSSPAS